MADLVYRSAVDTGTPVDTPPPSPQGAAMQVADWWRQAQANATPPSSRPETPAAVSPRSATGAYAVAQEAPVMASEAASLTGAEIMAGQMYPSGYMTQDGYMAQDGYAAAQASAYMTQDGYMAQDGYAAQE